METKDDFTIKNNTKAKMNNRKPNNNTESVNRAREGVRHEQKKISNCILTKKSIMTQVKPVYPPVSTGDNKKAEKVISNENQRKKIEKIDKDTSFKQGFYNQDRHSEISKFEESKIPLTKINKNESITIKQGIQSKNIENINDSEGSKKKQPETTNQEIDSEGNILKRSKILSIKIKDNEDLNKKEIQAEKNEKIFVSKSSKLDRLEVDIRARDSDSATLRIPPNSEEKKENPSNHKIQSHKSNRFENLKSPKKPNVKILKLEESKTSDSASAINKQDEGVKATKSIGSSKTPFNETIKVKNNNSQYNKVVTIDLDKQLYYGFSSEEQATAIINNIIQTNTTKHRFLKDFQDAWLLKRYTSPRKLLTPDEIKNELKGEEKPLDHLRDKSGTLPLFELNPQAADGFIQIKNIKNAGNDEFFQTKNAALYYLEDFKMGEENGDYGYRHCFRDFRHGVNTFVHAGNRSEAYKDEKPLAGHSGHLRRFKFTKGTTGEITGKSKQYHDTRDNALYDGQGKLKSLGLAIADALKAHLEFTYNDEAILAALGKISGNFYPETSEAYEALSSEERTNATIFSSTGLELPGDKVDFARTMQLNRDKIKIVYTAIQSKTEKNIKRLGISDINKSLIRRGVSILRINSLISKTYVENIIARVNDTNRDPYQLGVIIRERAPVIKTKKKIVTDLISVP